ncbi:ABC transporter permease [Aquibacillus halophilus]|uniref:ABC transporter permease n=2 Tax=Aquibacillus halophilus TaxID=930132 RepID=A0A6A8D6D6_9BACI|nr:ABC transporter permease [Aquibacillus halophilus]
MLMALVPLLIWVFAFEIIPVFQMVVMSFQNSDGLGFTLDQYYKGLTTSLYLEAMKNSIVISINSSVAAMIIALFVAYSITRFTTGIRDQLLMVSNMMTNFAGVPLAFAYMILMGNNGALLLLLERMGVEAAGSFDLYSQTGVTQLYIYYQTPLAILLVYPIFYGIRTEWKEAASLLGASTWKFWRYIGIPVLLPGLLGTFSLLIANALGAYATAYALTGISFNLLTIRIAALVSGDIFPNFQLGSALAVILAIIMIFSLVVNELMLRWSRRRGT